MRIPQGFAADVISSSESDTRLAILTRDVHTLRGMTACGSGCVLSCFPNASLWGLALREMGRHVLLCRGVPPLQTSRVDSWAARIEQGALSDGAPCAFLSFLQPGET
jgi:hypothetical protein